MTVDTAATPSNASLSVRDAAALFQAPEPKQEPEAKAAEPAPVEPEKVPEAPQAEAEPNEQEEAGAEDSEKVTIEVDGKPLELTKAQLAEAYKSGLRQADYTKKTMETAEQRKAAEAETAKAREERQKYAQGLQQAQALLTAQLQEQGQIDWPKLLEADPVEYLKQQHLAQARQARLNQVLHEQQQLSARQQAEQDDASKAFLREQHEALLAKLPEWKDDAKAKAEKTRIADYLKAQGLSSEQINNMTDHRAVLLSRKAMLYDQMMSKAQAAAKKVAALPQKVERPGGGETSATDGRTTAMKQLAKSGSLRDAARVFENLF